MLRVLLLRLRACRHPMRALLMARPATPGAERATDYRRRVSEAHNS